MRRVVPAILWLIVVGGLALACGDDGAGDASDAGNDDAEDVTVVRPPDARDSSGPAAPWRHEPVITVQDDEPCEDWIPVERMARGLPEDTTPRLLWRYRPTDDPLYSGPVAAFHTDVSEPVVSLDGTIWVRGPRAAHVTQISRDGQMRRWFRAGGADENDPRILARMGPLLPLPNGRVVAAIYSEDGHPRGGFLTTMDPQRRFSPAANAEGGAVLPGLDHNTKLAVGAQGVVYVTAGDKLYATCRGERLMWTLTNEMIEPGVGDGRFFYLRVETDGSVTVSGGAQRSYRVDPATLAINASDAIALADGEALSLRAQTESVSVFNVYSRTVNNLVVATSAAQVRFAGVPIAEVSPAGPIHFWDGPEALALDAPYTGEPRAVPSAGQFDTGISWWLSSGDWVRIVAGGITRFDHFGEEVWNVPVGMDGEDADLGGETRVLVIDDAGVVFSSLQINGFPIELAAFQTDALPPPTSVCVQDGCNAHRDNRVRPPE